MSSPSTITIYVDRKCKICGKKGATNAGVCLRCVADAIKRKVDKPTK